MTLKKPGGLLDPVYTVHGVGLGLSLIFTSGEDNPSRDLSLVSCGRVQRSFVGAADCS